MVSAKEKEIFQAHGILRIENFLPAEKVEGARQVVLRHLGKAGIWREVGWHLDELPPDAKSNNGAKLIAELKKNAVLGELVTEEMKAAIAELADGQIRFSGEYYPDVLFTLPNASEWFVPHNNWHMDVPRIPDCPMPGVQIFSFLDTVVKEGGGTLVVAGSHRFVNEGRRINSADVKKKLKQIPYFHDLFSASFPDRQRLLAEPVRFEDVDLQVVELVGKPGDVYFTDMRILHNVAPNAARVPRIMLTQRFLMGSLQDLL